MKKKLLALVCMITCVFALTACGNEETYTDFEATKLAAAENQAVTYITTFTDAFCQGIPFDVYGMPLEELTMDDIETIVYEASNQSLVVEGYAVRTGVESFNSALETIGEVVSIDDAKATIDGNQIVVNVNVTGEKKNATAEIVFSNTVNMKLESASLNPVASFGEMMKKAGLNTLIGMGTVFMVLILISLIISAFAIIPKIQKAIADKKAAKKAQETTETPAAVETVEVVDETDDLELVAVIAAAIAASEGQATTDGFVVRSIIRRA